MTTSSLSWSENQIRFDVGFIISLALLIGVGLVLVATSSIEYSAEKFGNQWYIIKKQAMYLALGIFVGMAVASVPIKLWSKYSIVFLILGLLLLVAVLIPGIGKVYNGSRRWLSLGVMSMQASEMAKICLLIFFAGFLNRRVENVQSSWTTFFVMIFIIGSVSILLLLEPDFGSAVVISVTLGSMMFIAGVPFIRFLLLAILAVGAFSVIAIFSQYRVERLIAFLDPWSNQFNSGYQLVQSLIGFGRGELLGVGLGNGVQKALFLPEAHTDFVFSVLTEEFGLIGAVAFILLIGYFISRIFKISVSAIQKEKYFGGFLSFGIGFMIATQSFINMGVASGLLPTKGLTLPFVSYGGSSLLVTCILIALVFRVGWENRNEK